MTNLLQHKASSLSYVQGLGAHPLFPYSIKRYATYLGIIQPLVDANARFSGVHVALGHRLPKSVQALGSSQIAGWCTRAKCQACCCKPCSCLTQYLTPCKDDMLAQNLF